MAAVRGLDRQLSSWFPIPGSNRWRKWVPWAELVLGLAILSGILLRWSALVASLVLTLFFAVLIRSYALGIDVDCGCFGSGEAHLGPLRLAEEAAMLALALGVTIAAFRGARRATVA